jgi:hypothetical protein
VIVTNLIDTFSREKESLQQKFGDEGKEDIKTIVGLLSKLKYELQTDKVMTEVIQCYLRRHKFTKLVKIFIFYSFQVMTQIKLFGINCLKIYQKIILTSQHLGCIVNAMFIVESNQFLKKLQHSKILIISCIIKKLN